MFKAAVLTISDSRSAGLNQDTAGPAVVELLRPLDVDIVDRRVLPDDEDRIAAAVRELSCHVALVVTTGGTGIGPRDRTPEALQPLFDRCLPGFGEIMRTGSFADTPLSIVSRGGAGIVGKTLVVMLPGSPRGVRQCLKWVGPAIQHVLEVLSRESVDCQAAVNDESRASARAAANRSTAPESGAADPTSPEQEP
ncbi:MAG: molybdenum cofactor biosynthesis protein B [Phycisphaerae bacterium]